MATITELGQLRDLVRDYCRFDAYCIDVETVPVYEPHEEEEYARIRELSPKDRTIDEEEWMGAYDKRGLDPWRNEVIWVGLATYGRSDAIPIGHPNGRLLVPAHEAKSTRWEVYGPDDERAYTKGGKPSAAAVKVKVPAKFSPPPAQLPTGVVFEELEPLLLSDRLTVNHNIKFDLKSLFDYYQRFLPPPYMDTQIAQHTLTEAFTQDYKLATLVEKHFHYTWPKLGRFGVQNFSFAEASRYSHRDPRVTWFLWRRLKRAYARYPELWRLLTEVESELLDVLLRAEWRGISLDLDKNAQLRAKLESERTLVTSKLRVDHAGRNDFNPGSPLQVKAMLYKGEPYRARTDILTDSGRERQKLGIPTTPDDYSTNATALAGITERYKGPVAEAATLLVRFNEIKTQLGTFVVGMRHRLDPEGLIHPDFYQHGTDTGRLSCHAPNLQNIPRESDVREQFIAPPGFVIVRADFDQIELRYIAYAADERTMIEVFATGADIHAAAAEAILGRPPKDGEERTKFGKMPNFLVAYGGQGYNLAQRTGISVKEGDRFIEAYFRRFKGINPWKARTLRDTRSRAMAQPQGKRMPYVETMLGRRRRLPELFAQDNKVRAKAERQAINTIVQGSAAEICKLAMINVDRAARDEGFPLQIVINVHDEVLALVPERQADEGLDLLLRNMMGVRIPWEPDRPIMGEVPLVAQGGISDVWKKD